MMDKISLFSQMHEESLKIHDEDGLCEIYRLQELLMRGYNFNGGLSDFPLDLKTKNGVQDFRNCIYHLITELTEAEKELKNRPNYKREIPEISDGFRKEMSDILHLTMELFILAGITPMDMVNDFRRVNKENWEKLIKDAK